MTTESVVAPSQNVDVEYLHRTIESLESTNVSCSREISKLRDENAAFSQSIDSLNKVVVELRTQLHQACAEKEELEKKLAKLQAASSSQSAEVGDKIAVAEATLKKDFNQTLELMKKAARSGIRETVPSRGRDA